MPICDEINHNTHFIITEEIVAALGALLLYYTTCAEEASSRACCTVQSHLHATNRFQRSPDGLEESHISLNFY